MAVQWRVDCASVHVALLEGFLCHGIDQRRGVLSAHTSTACSTLETKFVEIVVEAGEN